MSSVRRLMAMSVSAGCVVLMLAWPIHPQLGRAEAPAPGAATPLELLPDYVEGVFQVRGLDGFRKKLHAFLRETMPAAADVVQQALDEQVQAFLEKRERKELDGERPLFLAVVRWQDLEHQPPPVIIGLPVRDADAFLRSFLMPEERKQLRQHFEGCQRTVIAEQEVFLLPRGGYVLLTPLQETAQQLARLPNQPPRVSLAQRLTPQETQRWADADLAAYVKLAPLVQLAAEDIREARQFLEATRGLPFGPTALALGTVGLDLLELGREVEHSLITARLEKEGVRVQVSARIRPESPLAQTLSAMPRENIRDVDRLPPGLVHYGSLPTACTLEPLLHRYQQVVRQPGTELPKDSARIERLLADTASQLLESQCRRVTWAFDMRYRGMIVLETAKAQLARQTLLRFLEELAKMEMPEGVRFHMHSDGGKLLGRTASRAELEVDWGPLIGAHGLAGNAEVMMLQHMFGHQWTLWLVADEQRIFLISTRDAQEAERWLQNYREGNVPAENATLQRHRQPLGEVLSGLVMLQFNGLWRHLLETLDKTASAQGLGNLIPKEAYPEAKSAFFSLGLRFQREGLELELWAPRETLSELNRLFLLAVHGLF
ncbi:MAG: hypothetical protein RMJ19_07925 [Gemmatales bacterium]|nr:hypothetical protein [Gemmatales bacterium]MDW8175584.1 hypothetical protein [Gemmatales bacterium]